MGNTDRDEEVVDARRAFVRRLRDDENVRRVNFSRDGFRVVFVGLEPGAEFHDRWHRTATRLGYTVERVEADDAEPDWPEDVWVLQLADAEDSTERAAWQNPVRSAVARMRAFVDRLRGRS